MNKADLVTKVSVINEITKAKANEIVSTIVEEIQKDVAEGNRVNLAGLGVFESRVRTARDGRDADGAEHGDVPSREYTARGRL